MRLLGSAVLCLCIAASWNSAFGATVEPLDSDAIVDLAGDFSDFFVRVGPVGLWEQIQACYKKASRSGDMNGIRSCIILDEAGKALDDNRVNAVKAEGGSVRNREWYQNAAFHERMATYSQAAFGDPNAYVDFWDVNKKAFGTALRKLNLH
jgi:hypothetical protein